MAARDKDPSIANPRPGANPGYAEAQPRDRAEARQPAGSPQPTPDKPAVDDDSPAATLPSPRSRR